MYNYWAIVFSHYEVTSSSNLPTVWLFFFLLFLVAILKYSSH